MSQPLKLLLTKVTCDSEQSNEWGKDEMYLLGFGTTGGGQRLVIPPTSIGSYGTGDVNQGQFPMTLVNVLVNDGEGIVAFCVWLFERDSGGLASSGPQLAATFNNSLNARLAATQPLGLDPQAQHLYCFAQSMVDVRFAMDPLAASNVNSDDILQHHFQTLLATLPQPLGADHNVFEAVIGPDGIYTLQFDCRFRMTPIVFSGMPT
jgi:hypothetical protein